MRLAEEQRSLYGSYLKSTQDIYERLARLLGITIDKDTIPDEYISLYTVNNMAKRKIAIDRAIELLKTRQENTLSDNEKEALKIDKEMISPIREEYLSRMKMAVTGFTFDVKEIFKNKEPATSLKNASEIRAIILLDNKQLSQAAR
jgi:hypothetical protein